MGDVLRVNRGVPAGFVDPSDQMTLSSDRGWPYLEGASPDLLGAAANPKG